MLSLNVLFLGLSLVVIDAAPVKLDEATSKTIETNYNQGLRSGANNRLAFPSYDGINKIPIKIEYDFPAQINATAPAPVAYAAPAPVAYAAPAPVQIADAPVHVVPHAFETRVHYAETPVVVGHTSQIMKPNLGAGAHVTNFDDMGLAQTKNAAPESIVQKSQILAPTRTVSEITPQVTDQHRTYEVMVFELPDRPEVYMYLYGTPEKPLPVKLKWAVATMKKLFSNALDMLKKLSPPPPSAGTNTPPPPPATKAAPAPVQIAAAPVHVVPHAFETKGETRVVVGHTSRIMKPNLGAGVFDDSMGLAQTKNAVPLFYIKQLKLKAPVPYNIDVEWQANGRQSSLDSQFTGDHLPTPPPMPEQRLIKKIGNILHSHIIPDGSLLFVNVAKSPVGPNVRRLVSQKIAADSNESLESEESTEVEESDSREQVGTGAISGAISRGSYSFTTPDGVVLTVNWVADESGFEGTGDHLPTPPPMPEHVVKMLIDLKAAHLL